MLSIYLQELHSASFIKQNYSAYTEADFLNWNRLLIKQQSNIQDKACKEFLLGLEIVHPLITTLPNLNILSKQLEATIGWGIIAVNSFLEADEYFNYLLNGVFPVNISLRKNENISFDPLPDLFHDCFGHLPLLANSLYSKFVKEISRNFLLANERKKRDIANLYWYTIEAGVCYEDEQLRVYGGSQLSSFDELAYSLSGQPIIHNFNLQKILELQPYPYAFQEEIFAIPNFEYLAEVINQMDWLMKN